MNSNKLLVIYMILLVILSSPALHAGTAVEDLAAGLGAAERGDLETAKKILASVVSVYPESSEAAEASWKLGKIAHRQKQPETARDHFLWVVNRHPESSKAPDSWLSLALMARAKKPSLAMERLEKLVVSYPTTNEAKIARFRLASIYNDLKHFDKAIAVAQAVRNDPDAIQELKATATIYEGQAHIGKWKISNDEDELVLGISLLESVKKDYPQEIKG